MVGLGERWIFFVGQKKGNEEKFDLLSTERNFLFGRSEVVQKIQKNLLAMNFLFCNVIFERRRCV